MVAEALLGELLIAFAAWAVGYWFGRRRGRADRLTERPRT